MNRKAGVLGIMVASQAARKAMLARYSRYHTSAMRLICFAPEDIDWENKSLTALHRSKRGWKLSRFAFPHVLYNRCYELDPGILQRWKTELGEHACFNHINHFDKFQIHEYLARRLEANIPAAMPYDGESAAKMLAEHKLLYLKPVMGNKGIGVFRVELKPSGVIHIGDHHLAPRYITDNHAQFEQCMQDMMGTSPYFMQRGINTSLLEGRAFDIRALVQKNRRGRWSVSSTVSRVALEGCFNTSIFEKMCRTLDALHYLYAPERANDIHKSICRLSLLAAKYVEEASGNHLGELSVDFALDTEGRPWIIELNAMPQKSLYRALGKERTAYRRPLEYAAFLHRSRQLARRKLID
jgi:hypothetical protein